jgi:hypothetical protein
VAVRRVPVAAAMARVMPAMSFRSGFVTGFLSPIFDCGQGMITGRLARFPYAASCCEPPRYVCVFWQLTLLVCGEDAVYGRRGTPRD